ncbi:MAG: hypothetical protein SLAVMIC_00193 [uncultured marine phage]|uniref:Uncharacterized protein n=1 Tax=uncultured marine phage TaxID=707152 RepID=A0A8D9FQ11_9VIRU|nr:MAG: hypothetical protein SLAVMIC_00193 [uncultured marine phage]
MKYLKLFEELNNDISKDVIRINRSRSLDTYGYTDEVFKLLGKYCKPFLEELRSQNWKSDHGKNFLFRFYDVEDFITIKETRKDRLPKDTSDVANNLINDIWKKIHNEIPRKEGVFVTNNPSYMGDGFDPFEQFSHLNIFFPIGEYKYFYHEKVDDLYPFMMGSGFESSTKYSKLLKEFLSNSDLGIEIGDITDANLILNWENTNYSYVSNRILDALIRRANIDPGRIKNGVLQGTDEEKNEIKRIARDWAQKTLRILISKLVSEYKSEGLMDCPNSTEATFLCDNYLLINENWISYPRLKELIKG